MSAPPWVPVFWKCPADELPEDEETVLLALDDGEVWTGFHEAGEWRYVSADLCEAAVLWWARFPDPPAPENLPDVPAKKAKGTKQ